MKLMRRLSERPLPGLQSKGKSIRLYYSRDDVKISNFNEEWKYPCTPQENPAALKWTKLPDGYSLKPALQQT
jgi:hypothetical protein